MQSSFRRKLSSDEWRGMRCQLEKEIVVVFTKSENGIFVKKTQTVKGDLDLCLTKAENQVSEENKPCKILRSFYSEVEKQNAYVYY